MKTIMILVLAALFKVASITVTSPSFPIDGMIPSKYTCDGENLSPPLHFQNIPMGAKTMAIIMHDPDAPLQGGFTHWVAWNISVMANIPENYKGGEQGLNRSNKSGYTGPCPPSGTHHYYFYVYALDTELILDKTTDKEMLEKAMEGHILATGSLVGLYQKKDRISVK